MHRQPPIQRGFSLVELMIAMALGLAMIAAVARLSLEATRSYRSMNQASQQIENGRYALTVLKGELEHAGFWGVFSPWDAGLSLPDTASDPCNPSPQNLATHFLLPIAGHACSAYLIDVVKETSVLAIQRADTAITAPSAVKAGNTYLQTSPHEYMIGTGCKYAASIVSCANSASNKDGAENSLSLTKPDGSRADLRQYHVNIYYIRSWSSQAGDGIPTLVRKSPADSDSNVQALVEGIENMQILYGLDHNGDGSPDRYETAPAQNDISSWSNVVAVRLSLLVRSLEPDPNYTDAKTYLLGSQTIPAQNDHYRRRVFSQVVRLVNVSTRREQ
jgi:type IV pilus assembly protein PilW